jgi:hypothetical protein
VPLGQPWVGCQTWISEMGPKKSAAMSSMERRRLAEELPWLPVWVMTLEDLASSRSWRASAREWVRGFSQ